MLLASGHIIKIVSLKNTLLIMYYKGVNTTSNCLQASYTVPIYTIIYDPIKYFQSVKTIMTTMLIVLGIINDSMQSMSKGNTLKCK